MKLSFIKDLPCFLDRGREQSHVHDTEQNRPGAFIPRWWVGGDKAKQTSCMTWIISSEMEKILPTKISPEGQKCEALLSDGEAKWICRGVVAALGTEPTTRRDASVQNGGWQPS